MTGTKDYVDLHVSSVQDRGSGSERVLQCKVSYHTETLNMSFLKGFSIKMVNTYSLPCVKAVNGVIFFNDDQV